MRRTAAKRHILVFAVLVGLANIVALSGCGGSSDTDQESSASASDLGLVAWPLFGRVPERTHYLAARERALDPPLRRSWTISTHALIEFPPAVAGGRRLRG